jgi:predicted branched-subunit amino acid permease
LIVSGAPLWLVFAAGLVVNLRFVIFAAALHPYLRSLSWPRRLFLGYFTTDVAFVMFMPRYGHASTKGLPEHIGYFLGCITPGWFVWQGSSILGIYVSGWIPTSWSPEFAAILALMAITVPLIVSRPVLLAAVAAGVVAWVAQPLPLRLGLIMAVITGIVVGMWAERASHLAPPDPAVARGKRR